MERAYFRGKQAGHLSGTPGRHASSPGSPWEKTHLSRVSSSHSAQITWVQPLCKQPWMIWAALLPHQYCSTAEKRSKAEPSVTEHLQSREKKSWDKEPLNFSSVSLPRKRGGGSSDLGEEMGCGQMLEFKTVVCQQAAFHKIHRDSASSGALQAELQPAMGWWHRNFFAHGAGIEEGERRVKGSEWRLRKHSACTGIPIRERREKNSISSHIFF